MSKFFIQMLLTALLGVSAAAGFSSNVRGRVAETFREANTFARQATQSVFNTAASVNASVDVSTNASVNANAHSKAGSSLDLSSLSNLLPKTNVDGSASTKTKTNVKVRSGGASLNLGNTLQSVLDLGLETGK